jgi:hypothetical protein
MKVYVITSGVYSAYHICAVTIDKDRASTLSKLFIDSRGNDANIEVYDTEAIHFTPGMVPFEVGFKGTSVTECCRISIEDYDADFEKIWVSNNDDGYVKVEAVDEAHAIKIASDMYAKYRAEKLGL